MYKNLLKLDSISDINSLLTLNDIEVIKEVGVGSPSHQFFILNEVQKLKESLESCNAFNPFEDENNLDIFKGNNLIHNDNHNIRPFSANFNSSLNLDKLPPTHESNNPHQNHMTKQQTMATFSNFPSRPSSNLNNLGSEKHSNKISAFKTPNNFKPFTLQQQQNHRKQQPLSPEHRYRLGVSALQQQHALTAANFLPPNFNKSTNSNFFV